MNKALSTTDATTINPFSRAPQFREVPLPPPTRPPKRKRLPAPIGKEERLEIIRDARTALDEADALVGSVARQTHAMRGAIGKATAQDIEHFTLAMHTLALAGCEQLKTARAKLNSLETIVLHGSHIAPVKI